MTTEWIDPDPTGDLRTRVEDFTNTLGAGETLACLGAIAGAINGLPHKLSDSPSRAEALTALNTASVYSGVAVALARRLHRLGAPIDLTAVDDLNRFMCTLTTEMMQRAKDGQPDG